MKSLLTVQRGTTIHRCAAQLAAIALFVALLLAAPFHAALAQTAPNLATAANFAVLDGTEVTCTAPGSITGNVGVVSGTFTNTTGCTIVGAVPPATNPLAPQAYSDFLAAYASLAAYQCTGTLDTVYTGVTVTLAPGVYCNTAGVTFTDSTLVLDAGNSGTNAVWIFKIGTLGTGALTGTNFSVVMANGGQPCNVYWWMAEAATMTTSSFKGNLLAGAATTVTGGSFMGRDFAKAAVTLTGANIVSCTNIVPPPVPPVIPPAEYCKDYVQEYCHDFCKDKDHDWFKKPCNQGVGNGPEDCDPGNSNQGDDDRSNDEHGGKPGDPGRKGGNDKDHDKDHRGRR